MAKIKTKQTVAKRFKITKNKKVIKQTCGQDHFNARESGKTGTAKKLSSAIGKADRKNIKRFIPYGK